MTLTMSASVDPVASMTSAICSRKPPRFSNSARARTSSLQILQPARRVGRLVLLPHRRVAALVQHGLRDFDVGRGLRQPAPALDHADETVERPSRLRPQDARGTQPAAPPRTGKRPVPRAARAAARIAASPSPRLGLLTMRSKAQVVVGRMNEAQVSDGVADFQPFVEARAADHAVGNVEGDEPLLELAGLEAGAHQDGDLVQGMGLALQVLDPVGDRARLFLAVPHAGEGELVAAFRSGPKGLAEAAVVAGRSGGTRRRGSARVER